MGKEEKEGFQVERKFMENYSGEECMIRIIRSQIEKQRIRKNKNRRR